MRFRRCVMGKLLCEMECAAHAALSSSRRDTSLQNSDSERRRPRFWRLTRNRETTTSANNYGINDATLPRSGLVQRPLCTVNDYAQLCVGGLVIGLPTPLPLFIITDPLGIRVARLGHGNGVFSPWDLAGEPAIESSLRDRPRHSDEWCLDFHAPAIGR